MSREPIAPGTPDDPVVRFEALWREVRASDVPQPDAMVLSTVSAEGQPSSRVVLLKGVDPRGFVFYTNCESRKGRELAANPRCSLLFHWQGLGRQVIVSGTAEPVDPAEADAYFATRPRLSQLGAWASQQSRPMLSRARLMADVGVLEGRWLGRAVPRPPHWSGFRVVPRAIEHWHEGLFRLHERALYERTAEGWMRTVLYP